jgi:hypothetical protein
LNRRSEDQELDLKKNKLLISLSPVRTALLSKARFYSLTRKGKELTREESEWRRIAAAIMRILGPAQ